MKLWAIIPVKPLRRGKSRLASVLSEDQRASLNQTLLGNTLHAVQQVPEIDQALVISRDPSALAVAREMEARTIQEEGMPELNRAIQRATVFAQLYSAGAVLILPADLPLLTAADLSEFIRAAGEAPVMAIAPDRRRDGTNAILINPAGAIQYHYGPGSFEKHLQQAVLHNVRTVIYERPAFGLDLDLPEDLDYLRDLNSSIPATGNTNQALSQPAWKSDQP